MEDVVLTDMNTAKKIFLDHIRQNCRGFIINDSNRSAISNIFNWCLRNNHGELNPRKGLWLYGNIGTGKSTIMKSVLSFIEKYWLRDSGEKLKPTWENVPSFCGKYAENGFAVFNSIPTALDELGTECVPTNHIGNKLNVIAHVICSMSEENICIPKIVTTNLSFSDVEKYYGARTVDRIGELFNLVAMHGDSWRKDSDKIWDIIEAENKSGAHQ